MIRVAINLLLISHLYLRSIIFSPKSGPILRWSGTTAAGGQAQQTATLQFPEPSDAGSTGRHQTGHRTSDRAQLYEPLP